MHNRFSFKGIVRSNDNMFSNDGECLELVNMRMVNGSLKPIPEPKSIALLPGLYSAVYRHPASGCHLCIVDGGRRDVDFYDAGWAPMLDNQGQKLHFPILENVNAIEFVGNLVCCMTESGILFLLFGNATYIWLGERPVVPVMDIDVESKVHSLTTETAFTRNTVDAEISSVWNYNSKGYFDECIEKANKDGYFVDRALFRFALRLYDGSYIYCSQPFYVCDESSLENMGRDKDNLQAYPVDESTGESQYRVKVLGFKPSFSFRNLRLEDWEGVVMGIDIFTSGSIMGKKVEQSVLSLLNTATKSFSSEKYDIYKEKGLDKLWNEIDNVSLYYKVAEYDIYGREVMCVDDVSQANIVLQESLSGSESSSSLSSIVPACSYMYNNRLHVASLREYFFKGFDASMLLPPGASERAFVDMVVMETKIKSQCGVSKVVNTFYNVEVGYRNGKFEFSPLLVYPDARAFEMSLFVSDDTELFVKRFPLTPHKLLNQAQYLHKTRIGFKVTATNVFASGTSVARVAVPDVLSMFNEEIGVHEVIYSSASKGWTYGGKPFPPEEFASLRVFAISRNIVDGDKIVFEIERDPSGDAFYDIGNIPFDDSWTVLGGSGNYGEENVYELREDVMKVSMTDNPFVFQARCTCSVPQGGIVALSTNKNAISEGQFGQHPLYVFSKNGIGVMATDPSGAVAYTNLYPVSYESCRNADSVCGTDFGVIFLGMQGVMAINGNNCVRISVSMDDDGKNVGVVRRSGVLRDIAALNGFEYVLDTALFMDYMDSAKVARDPETDEIVFCNSEYPYCYIYSLRGACWSKLGITLDGFVKHAAAFTMFARRDGQTAVYKPGDNVLGKAKVLLMTRPLLFGTKLPKRIIQLMFHAYVSRLSGTDATKPSFACFLLCSNDGVNFCIVTGCEKKDEIQDVVFPYFPTSSYRYFMFAFTGEIGAASMITALEVDVGTAWSNRLR